MTIKKRFQQISTLATIGIEYVKALTKERASLRQIQQFINSRKPIYLEVGAGDKKGANGWLTIDITPNCDIFWDLRKGIPFPDNSIAKIYSSHLLEHLTFKEGEIFLQECRRVLSPRGEFSVCVPNAKIYLNAYFHPETIADKKIAWYEPARNHTTNIDYVNYMAYMDGHHKYMFDEENLICRLKQNGFQNVQLRKFDPKLDLKERDFESIYAIAEA